MSPPGSGTREQGTDPARPRRLGRLLEALRPLLRPVLGPVRAALVGPASQADRPRGWQACVAAVERTLTHIEPSGPALRRLPAPPPYRVYGVYRRANAATVQALLASTSAPAAWWALDGPAAALSATTVGQGPGTRFANLNRVLAARPPGPKDWVVLCDDDVAFARGRLDQAVALAAAAGLDLAQPSHSPRSYLNWSVERHRLASRVRLNRFAEQGPLLILSPYAQQRVLPLPEDLGMGWGIEATWAADRSLRIGIVDAVMVRHLQPVAWDGNYDIHAEIDRARELMDRSSWSNWEEMQKDLGRWWWWEAAPPWATGRAQDGEGDPPRTSAPPAG